MSELDITGGDERNVGYYTGLIVTNLNALGALLAPHALSFDIGISLLCNRSIDDLTMESFVGLYWSQTHHVDWFSWISTLHAVFWAV